MFACGLGESEDAVRGQDLNAETQALIDTFRRLSRRSYASGLGALYAYESQFPGVASAKIEGLIDRYGIKDEETLRFFRVHESADVEHSAVCRELLDRLPEAERAEAIAAGEELAGALWNFLSGVEARASAQLSALAAAADARRAARPVTVQAGLAGQRDRGRPDRVDLGRVGDVGLDRRRRLRRRSSRPWSTRPAASRRRNAADDRGQLAALARRGARCAVPTIETFS